MRYLKVKIEFIIEKQIFFLIPYPIISAIFVHDENQKAIVAKVIDALKSTFSPPIVIQVSMFDDFFLLKDIIGIIITKV